MFIKPTTVFEIKKIISELHGSKSPGHDSLPAKIVKAVSEYIYVHLCVICLIFHLFLVVFQIA